MVTIEEAPLNARRIFATVDVHASSDGVWNVLTAYEKLQRVVPSLVKNEVLFRTKEGGARLSQVLLLTTISITTIMGART